MAFKKYSGKQLGVGQFGIVCQARAVGHSKDKSVRIVAVKMVKSNFDPTALESLASELKIMIYLGFHPNLVNLLGACTRDIISGTSFKYYCLSQQRI